MSRVEKPNADSSVGTRSLMSLQDHHLLVADTADLTASPVTGRQGRHHLGPSDTAPNTAKASATPLQIVSNRATLLDGRRNRLIEQAETTEVRNGETIGNPISDNGRAWA